MAQVCISLKDLPIDGQKFSFFNPKFWTEPWEKLGIPYTMGKPSLIATIFLIPRSNGCYIKCNLTGIVIVPCDRCTESAKVALNSCFEEYEEITDVLPKVPKYNKTQLNWKDKNISLCTIKLNTIRSNPFPLEEHRLIRWRGIDLELNINGLLWEVFILAMPVKLLCSINCPGLCSTCGRHLAQDQCKCVEIVVDKGLNTLHNLQIEK